jgi:hypothetical protein
MSQRALFDTTTAHCFWAWCKHTVAGHDPDEVHDRMEAHYATQHSADLDAAISPLLHHGRKARG